MRTLRRELTIAALMVVAAATPLVAHLLGARCWVFLPAHLPPLLAGLSFGAVPGLLMGLAAALADAFWGGRLTPLASIPNGLEFCAYGWVAGWLAEGRPSWRGRLFALLGAMVAGRFVHLMAAVVIGRAPSLPHALTSLFITPWPGMALELLLLPPLALWLAARSSS